MEQLHTQSTSVQKLLLLLALLWGTEACDNSGSAGLGTTQACCGTSSAALGVGVGGAQDANSTREVIRNGYVPVEDAIRFEAYFNDYDLSPPAAECAQPLCPRLVEGRLPTTSASVLPGAGTYYQLAFDSRYTKATLPERRKEIAFVCDVSGSMGERIGVETSIRKIDLLRDTLKKAVANLTPADKVGLVIFSGSAEVLLPLGSFNENSFSAAVDRLGPTGSTNMEDGVRKGLGLLPEDLPEPGVVRRIVLLTDALPNVGGTGPDTFLGMLGSAAEDTTAITMVGFGINFGAELVNKITALDGGNYAFIGSEKDADRFAEQFTYYLVPIATRFRYEVTSNLKGEAIQVFGVPGQADLSHALAADVGGLFLNAEGGGGVFFRLDPKYAQENSHPELRVAYSYMDVEGLPISGEVLAQASSGDEGVTEDLPISKAEGLRRGIVLIRYVMTLKNAIKSYEAEDAAAASKMLADLRLWLATQKELFQNEKRFEDDVQLIEILGTNMTAGAQVLKPDPSGIFYMPARP